MPAITLVALAGLAVTAADAQVTIEEDENGDRRTIIVEREGIPGHMNWTREYCDEEEECNVEIKVKDGERTVIVNGDTVQTDELFGPLPMLGHRRLKLGRPGADILFWHDLDDLAYGVFDDFADPATLAYGVVPFPADHQLRFAPDDRLRKMEKEARELARKARTAEGSDRTALENDLDKKLSEIFDYKSTLHERDIAAAEKRLNKMQERESKRAAARDQIIENRKQKLLGEESYLEW